jgi:hypothetical protein
MTTNINTMNSSNKTSSCNNNSKNNKHSINGRRTLSCGILSRRCQLETVFQTNVTCGIWSKHIYQFSLISTNFKITSPLLSVGIYIKHSNSALRISYILAPEDDVNISRTSTGVVFNTRSHKNFVVDHKGQNLVMLIFYWIYWYFNGLFTLDTKWTAYKTAPSTILLWSGKVFIESLPCEE